MSPGWILVLAILVNLAVAAITVYGYRRGKEMDRERRKIAAEIEEMQRKLYR